MNKKDPDPAEEDLDNLNSFVAMTPHSELLNKLPVSITTIDYCQHHVGEKTRHGIHKSSG